MKSFRDNAGRAWIVSIHVTAIKRVRAVLGIDLLSLTDDRFAGFNKLVSDPVALVDVLYVLCKDEADKLGISDEDFGRAMVGDAIESGFVAFTEELSDFFQDPRIRAGIKKVIAASQQIKDRMLDQMTAQLDTIDPDAEAAKLIASFNSARGFSESTPDPSPSETSP